MSSGGPYPATFDRHSSSISHFPLQGFSFSCSPASSFSSAAVTAHGSRPSAEGEFQHNSFSLAGEAQPLPVVELQSSWGTSNRLAMPFLLAAEEPASSPTRRPSSSSSSFSSPPHTTPTVGPNNHVHAAHQSEYAMPTIPVIPITLTDDEIGSRSERRGGALDQRLASLLPSWSQTQSQLAPPVKALTHHHHHHHHQQQQHEGKEPKLPSSTVVLKNSSLLPAPQDPSTTTTTSSSQAMLASHSSPPPNTRPPAASIQQGLSSLPQSRHCPPAPCRAQSSATSSRPASRRKLEEEYCNYLQDKLARLENNRQRGQSPNRHDNSTNKACNAHNEEEKIYLGAAAMESIRSYNDKALSFLPMENLRFTEESHLRALLRDASNQSTPFALKISAVLAFGALTSGQRQWADIFFDKWRRLLNEFFDSSDYEVAEGLVLMSYYCFYLGDHPRSCCFAENAADMATRARAGGGLVFIRAKTIIHIIESPRASTTAPSEKHRHHHQLFLGKPLLSFSPLVDASIQATVGELLEQLILISTRLHMWRTSQLIFEGGKLQGSSKRPRKRRQASGGIDDQSSLSSSSSSTCGEVNRTARLLTPPLHLLPAVQDAEERLDHLEGLLLHSRYHHHHPFDRKIDSSASAISDGDKQYNEASDLLKFVRFVLFCVRLDCQREACMTKHAFMSGEKVILALQQSRGWMMKFLQPLSPLVLQFLAPLINLLNGPLKAQFMSPADIVRSVCLLQELLDNLSPERAGSSEPDQGHQFIFSAFS